MDEFSEHYDNFIYLGDFNTCINNNTMMSFCSLNDLTILIITTCYKNLDKPRCIDLILRIALVITSNKTMSLKQAFLTFICRL